MEKACEKAVKNSGRFSKRYYRCDEPVANCGFITYKIDSVTRVLETRKAEILYAPRTARVSMLNAM